MAIALAPEPAAKAGAKRPDPGALLAIAAAAAMRPGGLPAGAAILLAGLTPPARAGADGPIAARFARLGRVALRIVP